jgi:hypothetical protein
MPLPEAMAGNFQDAARWFSQFWSAGLDSTGAARSAAGAVPSMFLPTLDIKELDKRIADLRGVEQWLTLNQNMLRTTIQSLEVQRQTLAAWQSIGAAAAAPATQASGPAKGTAEESNTPGASQGVPPPAFQPALWWAALQEQFAQLAAAAATQEAQRGKEAAPPEAPSAQSTQAKSAKPKTPGKEKP